jgi:hypothetical protein
MLDENEKLRFANALNDFEKAGLIPEKVDDVEKSLY